MSKRVEINKDNEVICPVCGCYMEVFDKEEEKKTKGTIELLSAMIKAIEENRRQIEVLIKRELEKEAKK
jgi:uncharacterized Zn finger protein (UPF0148 family)